LAFVFPWRLLLKVVGALLAVLLVYEIVTFAQVWQASRRDEAQPAEAIVVFGAAQYDGRPSPVLRARLDHAADLWRRELAPYIVVTGGKQSGDRFTEATASANYLIAEGVPDEAILREVSGDSSWDSLAAAARFMRGRGIDEVLLVSDPFHSARIKAMAGELGLRAHVSPTRSSPISGFSELKFMVKETVAVSLARVVGYRRLVRVQERAPAR
jgi:uncharacterized SAM-binding protein YcdF (DUF218 family)